MSFIDIDRALLTKLMESSAVTDVVQDRIYPGYLPDGVDYPAVYFDNVEGGSHNLLNGQSSGLAFALFEVGATALTRAEVKLLLEAIRVALVGFKGNVTVDSGTCNIQEISLEKTGQVMHYVEYGCFEGSLDLHVQWQEAKGNGE